MKKEILYSLKLEIVFCRRYALKIKFAKTKTKLFTSFLSKRCVEIMWDHKNVLLPSNIVECQTYCYAFRYLIFSATLFLTFSSTSLWLVSLLCFVILLWSSFCFSLFIASFPLNDCFTKHYIRLKKYLVTHFH